MLPAWLTLTPTGNGTAVLTGTPTNADVGQHAVMLQVRDTAGLTATQSFTLAVANVNDAPQFASTPITTATQGLTYTYLITVADPDLTYGDVLTFTAPTLPAWLALTTTGNGTAVLAGMPTNADVGQHAVTLQVRDTAGLTATQSFTLAVANVNDAPQFASTPLTAATQGLTYTYLITATDPDLAFGDVLTFTASSLPAWLALTPTGNGTAVLAGMPMNADVGQHAVTLQVRDTAGLTATQSFTLAVANVNDAPQFTSTPITAATQGLTYTYLITTTDPDLALGDVLTLTAPTLPAWLALTATGNGTAVLVGTPANADVGRHAVTLQVRDTAGLTATQSFTLAVANVNDAPQFASTPITTATQGLTYTYLITATDPDLAFGDVLTLTAPTLPAWLALTATGNGIAVLVGTPANADVGQHAVTLQVRDLGGLTATQSFTITVANINDAPHAADDTATTLEDTPVVINVLANDSDPDGDPLTISSVSQPLNGTAAISSTVIVYTPTLNFFGVEVLTYTISDGSLTDSASITVTVVPVNDPPTISDIPDQSTRVGIPVGPLTFTVGDVDSPLADLALSAVSSNLALMPVANITFGGNGATRTVTLTPTASLTGTSTLTVTVSDGSATASETFTLIVTQAPLRHVYLPLVVRNYVSAPNLMVQSAMATSQAVTVTIANQGNVPVTEAFWVHLYVDPQPVPTVWYDRRCKQGAAWAAVAPALPIAPGVAALARLAD